MILITGGMGFIGIQTARALAGRDDLVLGYHRSVRGQQELKSLIQAEAGTVRLDVASPYSVARAVAQFRPDSIIHLAVPRLGALPPAEESLASVQGLMNVLEAACSGGVRRVSVASSVAVYAGLTGGPFTEDRALPVNSLSTTGAMKKAEEVLALHHADRTGLDLRVLRIGAAYGPLYHTMANMVSRLTHLAVRGTLPAGLPGGWTPQQLGGMDLIHVEDCASAIAAIHMASTARHRIYNVGGGASVSAGQLVTAVEAAVPGAVLPDELRQPGTVELARGYMDISRARDEFGVVPRYDIASGVRQYVGWLREHEL